MLCPSVHSRHPEVQQDENKSFSLSLARAFSPFTAVSISTCWTSEDCERVKRIFFSSSTINTDLSFMCAYSDIFRPLIPTHSGHPRGAWGRSGSVQKRPCGSDVHLLKTPHKVELDMTNRVQGEIYFLPEMPTMQAGLRKAGFIHFNSENSCPISPCLPFGFLPTVSI